jgi:hypothetical protein
VWLIRNALGSFLRIVNSSWYEVDFHVEPNRPKLPSFTLAEDVPIIIGENNIIEKLVQIINR